MPLKIPFFRLGTWKHPVYGKISITQETFNQLLANFKNNVLGRPPFIRIGHDKNNNSAFGYAPAEGWVTDIKQEENILFGVVEPTTPEAEENIKTKRYRFASAEYNPNGLDKETGQSVGALLSAIALTNEPFLTKLPEATLLADGSDTFYLDFLEIREDEKNMSDVEMKTMLQKLSESVNSFIAGFKPAPQTGDADNKLTEQFAALQNQVQQLTESNKQLAERLETESHARFLAETEREAAAMVALGIPPVMVEQWKQLALSEPGRVIVKLADKDGKEILLSQADAMKNMLMSLPQWSRVQFGQQGSQAAPKAEEEIKLACDEDIAALGGKIVDGKYMI